MNAFVEGVITIALAVVGLAVISVLVSKNAQTGSIIQAGASGLANNIGIAEAPVTGASYTPVLAYPSSTGAYSFGS